MQRLVEWASGQQGSIVAFGALLAALIAAVSALTVAWVNALAASWRDRTNVRREYHRTILHPFLSRIDGDILTASALMDMLAGWGVTSDSTSAGTFSYGEFVKLTRQITSYDVASPIPRVPAMIATLKLRDRHLDECLYQLTIARIDFIQAAKRFVLEQNAGSTTFNGTASGSVTAETQKKLYAEARGSRTPALRCATASKD